MKVVLARPRPDIDPDADGGDTLDLPDNIAQTLITDGSARPADDPASDDGAPAEPTTASNRRIKKES